MHTLTFQVRGLISEQIASLWQLDGERGSLNAQRSAERLVKDGLLAKKRAHVRPLPAIDGPVWRGDEVPDLFKLEHKIQTRFSEPANREVAFAATPRGAALTGGSRGRAKTAQWQHDLHVGAVLVWLYQHRPEDAKAFVGEDQYVSRWGAGKVPDGLCMRGGEPYLAIESAAGSYTAKRLKDFGNDMQRRKLPFEVY